MLNRLFGNYLVEKQLLTNRQLDSLLPVPKGSVADVETIAVVNKVMAPAAVEELLRRMDKSSEHFGERAVCDGYLTDDKLDHLLTYRSNDFMRFVQRLLDENLIGISGINQLIDDFQRLGNYSEPQMSALIHDDLEHCVGIFFPVKSDMLKAFVLTFAQTVRRLIDSDMYMDRAYMAHSLQLDKYAGQSLLGDIRMRVYISAPGNGLLAIANYFNGGVYETVDDDALDNVGEFINCVNGLFATNLSYDDVSVDMNSPEYSDEGPYVSNEKMYVIPIHANGRCFKAIIEVYE